MKLIVLYVTFSDKNEAIKIWKYLLEKKLIACFNLFPIDSFYNWKGNIENSKEIAWILKTKKENWKKIKEEIKNMHSYEVPCITKYEIKANKEFENWVLEETKN